MKLNKKIAVVIMSLLSMSAFSQTQTGTKKYKCEIEFALGKYIIQHKDNIEKCIQNIPENENINLIYIISSANEVGNANNNKVLSQKRLDEVRSFLSQQAKLSQTKITEELSIGKNHVLGKKAHILILTTEKMKPEIKTVEKEIIISKEIPVEIKKEVSDYKFFISSRVGSDIYMKYEIAPYFSYGILGGIHIQKQNHIKFELGLSANQLVNDNVYTISTAYGLAGAYLTSGKQEGFFIGLRGLSGLVANQKQQTDIDAGGEVRLGYDTQGFSLGFGAGRTRYTTRIGLEVGFKL